MNNCHLDNNLSFSFLVSKIYPVPVSVSIPLAVAMLIQCIHERGLGTYVDVYPSNPKKVESRGSGCLSISTVTVWLRPI